MIVHYGIVLFLVSHSLSAVVITRIRDPNQKTVRKKVSAAKKVTWKRNTRQSISFREEAENDRDGESDGTICHASITTLTGRPTDIYVEKPGRALTQQGTLIFRASIRILEFQFLFIHYYLRKTYANTYWYIVVSKVIVAFVFCWMTQVTRDTYTMISVCLNVCARECECVSVEERVMMTMILCVCVRARWNVDLRTADVNDAKKCESLREINTQYTHIHFFWWRWRDGRDRNNRNT